MKEQAYEAFRRDVARFLGDPRRMALVRQAATYRLAHCQPVLIVGPSDPREPENIVDVTERWDCEASRALYENTMALLNEYTERTILQLQERYGIPPEKPSAGDS